MHVNWYQIIRVKIGSWQEGVCVLKLWRIVVDLKFLRLKISIRKRQWVHSYKIKKLKVVEGSYGTVCSF